MSSRTRRVFESRRRVERTRCCETVTKRGCFTGSSSTGQAMRGGIDEGDWEHKLCHKPGHLSIPFGRLWLRLCYRLALLSKSGESILWHCHTENSNKGTTPILVERMGGTERYRSISPVCPESWPIIEGAEAVASRPIEKKRALVQNKCSQSIALYEYPVFRLLSTFSCHAEL